MGWRREGKGKEKEKRPYIGPQSKFPKLPYNVQGIGGVVKIIDLCTIIFTTGNKWIYCNSFLYVTFDLLMKMVLSFLAFFANFFFHLYLLFYFFTHSTSANFIQLSFSNDVVVLVQYYSFFNHINV